MRYLWRNKIISDKNEFKRPLETKGIAKIVGDNQVNGKEMQEAKNMHMFLLTSFWGFLSTLCLGNLILLMGGW